MLELLFMPNHARGGVLSHKRRPVSADHQHMGRALAARRGALATGSCDPIGYVRVIADERANGDALIGTLFVYLAFGVLCLSDGKPLRGTLKRDWKPYPVMG